MMDRAEFRLFARAALTAKYNHKPIFTLKLHPGLLQVFSEIMHVKCFAQCRASSSTQNVSAKILLRIVL